MSGPSTSKTLLYELRDAEKDVAWSRFVDLYLPVIQDFCSSRGLQRSDAHDVSQEVLKAVVRAIQQFEYDPDKGTFKAWLYRVVRSKLANFFAKSAKQPKGTGRTTVHHMLEQLPAETPDEEAAWNLQYQKRLLHWATEQVALEVDEKSFEAFRRTTFGDESVRDVAAELGITAGAIYTAKHRIIKRIRETVQSVSGELEWIEPT